MSDEHNHGDHGHGASDHGDEGHGEHHAVNYTAIFGLLCLCTALSWIFDEAKSYLPYASLVVMVLSVALCKATFVLLYFMHIRFERAWKYVLLAPTGVLACALPFALAPDIAFHYYNVIVPQDMIDVSHGDGHGTPGHGPAAHGDANHAADDHAGHGDHGPADAHKHDADHAHAKGEAAHDHPAPADKGQAKKPAADKAHGEKPHK